MTKLSGSYESVVRGVSEQSPRHRRSGQAQAQDNMISDPVRGCVRRHGSIMQDEWAISQTAGDYDKLLSDTQGHRVFPFYIQGNEYDLIVRSEARKGVTDNTGFCACFSKAEGRFLDVSLHDDPAMTAVIEGGARAMVNLGRYVYLSGNTLTPAWYASSPFDNLDNKRRGIIWVRGGAYSRTFKVTVTKGGVAHAVQYKTVSSSYPNSLDTSDIPLYTDAAQTTLNKTYQKQINDRVNAYNSAVTAWIGTAAADITPENIAQKLVDALVAQGVAASRLDGNVVIEETQEIEVTVDDGGDGSLMIGVGNAIDNVDLVSSRHYAGKVVKVVPDTSDGNPVYLKALAKDGVSTGWTKVVWQEAAGYVMTPTSVFCMATVKDGVFYMAGSAAALTSMTGVAAPDYKPNKVGDDLSCPLPEFFGRSIDYLGLFQDRLVIGCGATLFFSRPGDYFNWWRKSVTSVQDDDPWEGYALGTEDDTIRWSTVYDRNLMLYGKRFQYIVSGRQVFTPKTASIVSLTAFEDAVAAPPKVSGNLVFYTKFTSTGSSYIASVHQVQPGALTDNPDSYNASQQLDTYLSGYPHEIVAMTSPNLVVLRTKEQRQAVYTYSYLDNQTDRLFDSWSRWTWANEVGQLVGLSKDKGDVLMYMLKAGRNKDGIETVWISAERFLRDTSLSDRPYMDSLRPLSNFTAPTADSYLHPASAAVASGCVALGKGSPRPFMGMELSRWKEFRQQVSVEDADAHAWVGVLYTSSLTPTNPYAKDQAGNPVLSGRLTLSSVKVAVADTGGMEVSVTTNAGTKVHRTFNGRVLGNPSNTVGHQPIVDTTVQCPICYEVGECSYTLLSIKWLPMTITSIDWVGQLFMNIWRV